MFQPVVLFIGLRYVRGRSCGRFGQFISLLSVIGMTLGVMALITLLSVMNGFERDLEKKNFAADTPCNDFNSTLYRPTAAACDSA